MSLTESRAGQQSPGAVPSSPRATRHRSSAWRDPRLLVGVVLVAASGLAGALLLTGDETVDVWAVSGAVAAGETVRADRLVPREVRFTDQADADRYLSADQPLPSGATLTRDVGAGELLPRSALSPAALDTVVEVPLRVPGEAVPATVRAGSVVDVWVTPGPETGLDGGAGSGTARLVLSDVRVLAVSGGSTALGPSAERQVMVGLVADQEDDLAEALGELATGSAVLVRRP